MHRSWIPWVVVVVGLGACDESDGASASELEALSARVDELEAELVALDGLRGEQGLQGEKGEKGEPGEVGAQGPPGATGAQGAPGEKGEVGPQGPVGPPGATGAQGAAGARGEPGPQGAQGPVGPQGPQGARGEQGPQGVAGPTGATGPQGPAGERGPAACGEGEAPTDGHVGELSLSGGTAPALAQLMVREFELRLLVPPASQSGGQSPRLQLEALVLTFELDAQQLGLFGAITQGQVWSSGTLSFEPGSGLASLGLGLSVVRKLSWNGARNAEQVHVVMVELATSAMTMTPESGTAVTWNFELQSGTGTLQATPMRFAVGGGLVGSEAALDLAATIAAPASTGGAAGSPSLARLSELTVLGAPVGNWTAQWMLRMGRRESWAHDAANMPLVVTSVESGAPIARLEASCLLVPSQLRVRSKGGRLEQDVSFQAGIVRTTNLDGLGTATSRVWNFVTNNASTVCP